MELYLNRKYIKSGYIIGELYVQGVFMCNTLEPPLFRRLHPAVPAGRYKVVLKRSTKFQAVRPYLVGVPERFGIMIHEGNEVKDTQGCILVGHNTQRGMVLQSRKTLAALLDVLQVAERAKDEVTITIS